jgi:glycosyltransferase involved in cell wall biosynthesis
VKKKILFYSSVKDKKLFDIQRFYKIDIQLLEEAGFDVIPSNKIWESILFWRYQIAFIYFYKYGFFVAFFAKLLFKQVYFTGGIDDLDIEYASPRKYYVQKLFFKLCNIFATTCIIVSNADMQNIRKIYNDDLPKNISFSEHTIDVDSFISKSRKKKQFATIAWMDAVDNVTRKGLDKALFLFKFLTENVEFSEYQFIIIGKKGEGSKFLETLAEKLNIRHRIIFTDNISESEKIQILSESEYYFQLSRYEGFGIAAIEALASGDIVIHSAKGGLKDSMQNYGIVFDIDANINIESEIFFEKLLKFDIEFLPAGQENIKARFSNSRRLEDFINIIGD